MTMVQFQKKYKLRINKKLLYLLLISFFSFSQNENKSELFTVFYNVENLFDTIDCPKKNDSEFLPNGKKEWNSKKYNQKIKQLNKVFQSINSGNDIDIIGLCEVENKVVINDLLKEDFLNKTKYNIIHKESPDNRGIDCALIINKEYKILKYDFIEVKINESSRPTRDIVYAKLEINNETFNLFVNHWPSRWGGKKETEHKRTATANILRKYLNDNIKKNEKILIMGDFNDYPSDNSILNVLEAGNKISKFKNSKLYNLMSINGNEINKGSYNYKGEWGYLDQIIVSSNFGNKSKGSKVIESGVFIKDWMLQERYGDLYPKRSFLGKEFQPNGFSDHLPIYCIIKF